MSINKLAQTISLNEFNNRFEEEAQGYRDTRINKIHFCPSDLGFKIDQADCLEVRECKKCWEDIKTNLMFRDKNKEAIKALNVV